MASGTICSAEQSSRGLTGCQSWHSLSSFPIAATLRCHRDMGFLFCRSQDPILCCPFISLPLPCGVQGPTLHCLFTLLFLEILFWIHCSFATSMVRMYSPVVLLSCVLDKAFQPVGHDPGLTDPLTGVTYQISCISDIYTYDP